MNIADRLKNLVDLKKEIDLLSEKFDNEKREIAKNWGELDYFIIDDFKISRVKETSHRFQADYKAYCETHKIKKEWLIDNGFNKKVAGSSATLRIVKFLKEE